MRIPAALAFALTCVLLSGACAPAPSAPTGGAPRPETGPAQAAAAAPAASAPAPPPAPSRITIGYSTTSAATAPLQLAQDQGVFRANALEVELVHTPGNSGPAALIAGQAQALLSGCVEVVSAVAAGTDFTIVLTTINRLESVVIGGPNIPDRDSLRGKRMGVSKVGDASHLATRFVARQLGLDPDQDLIYVQIGNSPERIAALMAGSIDGAIMNVDQGSLVGQMPGMRIVVDMTVENIPYCSTGLVVTRSHVRDNPQVVRRLVKSIVEATARFKLDQAEGTESVARFLNETDAAKVEHVWASRARSFAAKPYPDVPGLRFVIEEAAQTNEQVGTLNAEQMVDPRWIRELDESGHLDRLYASAGRAQ
jgi:NitT/TauT family transport system substrate-binding protein